MAIAFVQGLGAANGVNVTTSSVTLSAPLTVGNLVVVTVEWGATSGTAGQTITSVTDSGGNTYAQATGAFVQDSTFFRATDIWYAHVAFAASTITVHYSGNTGFGSTCSMEFSGAKTSSPFDSANSLDQLASAPPVSPTLTPSVAGELLVALCNSNATGESGVNSPWTAGNGGAGDVMVYLINPALSSQQAVFTPTTSQPFVSSIASFLPPASGPSAKKKSSMNLVF